MPNNNIQVIPFCAPLPQGEGTGVVGTITLRGQSAIIWFGWGEIETCENDATMIVERSVGEVAHIGDGEFGLCELIYTLIVIDYELHNCHLTAPGNPAMGSLSLSMPPPKHINYAPPSTQLLGGNSEEDMILGQQVSCRLAKKIGWPIYVSCSFNESGEEGNEFGLGLDVSPAMAVAVAEKEVAKILLREKERMTGDS